MVHGVRALIVVIARSVGCARTGSGVFRRRVVGSAVGLGRVRAADCGLAGAARGPDPRWQCRVVRAVARRVWFTRRVWSSQGQWPVRRPHPGCSVIGEMEAESAGRRAALLSGSDRAALVRVPAVVVARSMGCARAASGVHCGRECGGGLRGVAGCVRVGSGSRADCGRRTVPGLCEDRIGRALCSSVESDGSRSTAS